MDDGAETILPALERASRSLRTPCGAGDMTWRAWGDGPPLVLVHGAHGDWAHWVRNIAALADGRTVIAPDLPGYGDSELPPDPADGASFADALACGLDRLLGGATRTDVIGFSLGGVLATRMAARRPDLVRRLILVDTGGLGTPPGEIRSTPVRKLEGDAAREAHRFNLLGLMLKHEASVDALALAIQARNIPRARVNPRDLVVPDRLVAFLPQVQCPIDAIWGEHDAPHPDPDAQIAVLRRHRPDASMTVLDGAGHWSMYERADAFNAAALRLLGAASGPA